MMDNEQLPKGYKNTEVGVIPEDWEVKEFGQICYPSKSRMNPITSDSSYKCIELEHLSQGTGFLLGYANSKDLKSQKSFFEEGDVLFGKLRPYLRKFYFADFKGVCTTEIWVLKPEKYTSNRFLFHLVRSDKIVEAANLSTGTKMPRAEWKTVSETKIPVPTIEEQTAIATALSDADALINSLEKLIAKKRNIKQGAMQQLLKPKEGWEVKKLGNIGKSYGGLSGKSKLDFADGKFPYIPFMNIMSNPIIDTSYVDYVNIGVDENQNKALKGDLFFNGSSETPEEVGMCSVLLEDIPNLYLNSFCFGFRLNKDSKENGLYLSYYFRSSEGRKLFYSMAQGATRYNLSKSNFNKMEVSLPQPEQQNEIATILSDMDAEIQALVTKLEKYRKIKLGMMQNLLTGKIRLI
jgi:type I restriction enzyme S subunit